MSPSDPESPARVVRGGEVPGEVVAAIVAAVDASWPRPAPVVGSGPPASILWRFSGRWWVGRRPRAVSRRR